MSTSCSRSPLASQRSRWSGPQHHRQESPSCRSTASTASSRWMPRHEHNAPVPSPSSLGLDSSWTDLHHVGPLTPPFAITGSSTSAFTVAEALPLPDVDGGPSPVRSLGYVTSDKEEDHVHGYKTPFTKGPKLCILINRHGRLWCPICPGRMDRNWTWDAAKNHVLGLASLSSRADPKKRSRHRAFARNEGWLPPLSAAAAEEEDDEDDDTSI